MCIVSPKVNTASLSTSKKQVKTITSSNATLKIMPLQRSSGSSSPSNVNTNAEQNEVKSAWKLPTTVEKDTKEENLEKVNKLDIIKTTTLHTNESVAPKDINVTGNLNVTEEELVKKGIVLAHRLDPSSIHRRSFNWDEDDDDILPVLSPIISTSVPNTEKPSIPSPSITPNQSIPSTNGDPKERQARAILKKDHPNIPQFKPLQPPQQSAWLTPLISQVDSSDISNKSLAQHKPNNTSHSSRGSVGSIRSQYQQPNYPQYAYADSDNRYGNSNPAPRQELFNYQTGKFEAADKKPTPFMRVSGNSNSRHRHNSNSTDKAEHDDVSNPRSRRSSGALERDRDQFRRQNKDIDRNRSNSREPRNYHSQQQQQIPSNSKSPTTASEILKHHDEMMRQGLEKARARIEEERRKEREREEESRKKTNALAAKLDLGQKLKEENAKKEKPIEKQNKEQAQKPSRSSVIDPSGSRKESEFNEHIPRLIGDIGNGRNSRQLADISSSRSSSNSNIWGDSNGILWNHQGASSRSDPGLWSSIDTMNNRIRPSEPSNIQAHNSSNPMKTNILSKDPEQQAPQPKQTRTQDQGPAQPLSSIVSVSTTKSAADVISLGPDTGNDGSLLFSSWPDIGAGVAQHLWKKESSVTTSNKTRILEQRPEIIPTQRATSATTSNSSIALVSSSPELESNLQTSRGHSRFFPSPKVDRTNKRVFSNESDNFNGYKLPDRINNNAYKLGNLDSNQLKTRTSNLFSQDNATERVGEYQYSQPSDIFLNSHYKSITRPPIQLPVVLEKGKQASNDLLDSVPIKVNLSFIETEGNDQRKQKLARNIEKNKDAKFDVISISLPTPKQPIVSTIKNSQSTNDNINENNSKGNKNNQPNMLDSENKSKGELITRSFNGDDLILSSLSKETSPKLSFPKGFNYDVNSNLDPEIFLQHLLKVNAKLIYPIGFSNTAFIFGENGLKFQREKTLKLSRNQVSVILNFDNKQESEKIVISLKEGNVSIFSGLKHNGNEKDLGRERQKEREFKNHRDHRGYSGNRLNRPISRTRSRSRVHKLNY